MLYVSVTALVLIAIVLELPLAKSKPWCTARNYKCQ